MSVIELGHLLTLSFLTCPEVSSKVCHDSFCQSGSSVSLPCFTRNGGNAIPKHAGSEAKGSNPATGFTLLWVRNPFRGKFNHWQVSQKEAGRFSLNDGMDVKKVK
jgi:hypothetical protein